MEDIPFYIFDNLIYGMIIAIVSPLTEVIKIIITTIGASTIKSQIKYNTDLSNSSMWCAGGVPCIDCSNRRYLGPELYLDTC